MSIPGLLTRSSSSVDGRVASYRSAPFRVSRVRLIVVQVATSPDHPAQPWGPHRALATVLVPHHGLTDPGRSARSRQVNLPGTHVHAARCSRVMAAPRGAQTREPAHHGHRPPSTALQAPRARQTTLRRHGGHSRLQRGAACSHRRPPPIALGEAWRGDQTRGGASPTVIGATLWAITHRMIAPRHYSDPLLSSGRSATHSVPQRPGRTADHSSGPPCPQRRQRPALTVASSHCLQPHRHTAPVPRQASPGAAGQRSAGR